LDLLPADITVTQGGAVAQVDFFIPEGFVEKIAHHPMFTWVLALENLLRVEIQKIYIEVKLILSSSSSILLHFKTRDWVFCNPGGGGMMQDKSNGSKSKYCTLRNILNYSKFNILIMFKVIL